MSSTITTAATEYARRPADESYPSVEALVASAEEDKRLSGERMYNVRDLQAVAEGDSVRLRGPRGVATFTNWAFGQICRMVGAPARYLAELPAALAASCLNHGFSDGATSGDAVLLVKAPNGRPLPTIRAATSDSYGRVWDADLYGAIARTFEPETGQRWSLPPVWGGGVAGAYRGDRDSFLILTDGGSIVTDPTLTGGGGGNDSQMYRGIMVRNSEVGAASVQIETVLYRYICGNHMLWGASIASQYRRRHVGTKVLRDTVREIGRIARAWAERPASVDEEMIRQMAKHEIAHSEAAVVSELQKLGATKAQAAAAYKSAELHESASPRSFWGAAQGLTRVSQESSYQDARLQLDRVAGAVLARAARRVAA